MVDETNPDSMQEYKLQEGDEQHYVDEPATSETQRTIPLPKVDIGEINWRRFLVPVLIFAAIFMVYEIFSFSSARKNRLSEQNAANIQQVPTVSVPPPMVTQSISPNDQFVQAQNSINSIQQKLNALSQQNSSSHEQIVAMNNLLTKNQQDISNLTQNVNQINTVLQQTLIELQKIVAEKNKPKKKAKSLKPLTAYHVRAVVPGRVWLESAEGKTITLKVGDSLNGYGKVQMISPRQGMVVMSSGAIIQYGANDS